MTHSIRPDPAINPSVEFGARDAVEGGEEIFHGLGDGDPNFGRDSVELAAIAGGNDHGFFDNPLAAELVGRIERLPRGKGEAFAEFDRRRAMAATDERNLYSPCDHVSRVGRSGHQKKRWNLVRYKFTKV